MLMKQLQLTLNNAGVTGPLPSQKSTCNIALWLTSRESACQCRRRGFNPWVRKIPWRRKWQLQCSCLGNPTDRSLAGYSPWSCRVGHNLATKQQQILRPEQPWTVCVLALLKSLTFKASCAIVTYACVSQAPYRAEKQRLLCVSRRKWVSGSQSVPAEYLSPSCPDSLRLGGSPGPQATGLAPPSESVSCTRRLSALTT